MSTATLPKHIAIIMDGNRRWAKQHGLELFRGHEQVANRVVKELVEQCVRRGVSYVTFWAFSTENWQRDDDEVSWIMQLFRQAFTKNAAELHEAGVRLNMIGDLQKFPNDIQENVRHWLELSKSNTAITVTFALNYGGRDEILRATRQLAKQVGAGEVAADGITEEVFAAALDTHDMPDPDLIIRPGGEKRLSGLLPWQSVYSELYFTDVLMPDFNGAELDKALADYAARQRRFGK